MPYPASAARGSGPRNAGPLFYDNFTATNGVSLDAHTPNIGGNWSEVRGDWNIQNNQANLVSIVSGLGMAVVTTSSANVVISFIVKSLVNADNPSIVLRYVDVNNYIQLNINNGGNNVRLIQWLAGSLTVQNTSGAVTFTNGLDYALQVIASGTSIKVSVDGVQVLNTTNSNFLTSTKHGIYAEKVGCRIDEFQVTTL